MIQVISPENNFGPTELDLYVKSRKMSLIFCMLQERGFVLVKAIFNHGDYDWENTGIATMLIPATQINPVTTVPSVE